MDDTQQTAQRARDVGLPDYFDMQAAMGHTKHIGGWIATQELMQLCHLQAGQEILYVGCGSGVAAIKIAMDYDCNVVGVDVLEKMVASAREWAERRGATDRTEFRIANAQALPFEDDRFDVLICESVNTFVPDPDQAARGYVRVVKPGGYVGLNEALWIEDPPEAGSEVMSALTGQRLRKSEEWMAMLEGAGLVDLVDRVYAIEMRKEARSQFGFLSFGDYMRILGRFFSTFLFDPATRKLMRLALSEPRAIFDYMGYGLFVGKKPAN
ncbi:MAG: methyltransferase domain-containing protein [Anaerolineales bacterium]|nr:methyltransferase domain-containing protein [Anaerolineales bacterium]